MAYFSVQDNETRSPARFCLTGAWTVETLPAIKAGLPESKLRAAKQVVFDGKNLDNLDTSAAWYLGDLIDGLKGRGVSVELSHFQDNHSRIFERVSALPREKEAAPKPSSSFAGVVTAIGRYLADIGEDVHRGVSFFGEFLAGVALRVLQPQRLRLRSAVFHINEVGIKAAPIIAIMAFSIAFVTGYQGAFQLQKFDATIYTVDLVVLSILREMGVLIAAIMVAGRTGSAFAAQIGTMKLNEEVDALQTMGVSPFEVLVLPRLIGILIALPLLTVIADLAGLFGGYVFSSSYLGYSYVQFLSRMQEAADMRQFYVGLSKAPVFAVLIGIVGCMQGLQARGSAEDVGRRTITAVVQSIFLVIAADAIFSVIFTRMGI